LIDDEVRVQAEALICTAKENPYPFDRLQKIEAGLEKPPGDHYRIIIPLGYRVVYSIEQHPTRDGSFQWVQHLSVSVSTTTWPNLEYAVPMILDLFGIPSALEQCIVYLEGEDDPTLPNAINVVALCNDPPT
jgi:hypothetical protein